MMTLKKYIMINDNPILFPSDLMHAEVAGNNIQQVNSAGFFLIWKSDKGCRVICSGKSESLSVSSRPEIDQELISDYLELNHTCNRIKV